MELLDVKPVKSRMPVALGAVAVLIVFSLSGYFLFQNRKAQALLANPQEAAKVEVAKTVKKLSAHVDLPTDEEPTVATVTDVEKLRDKPFFARAEDGDRVVVYTNAKKAILFRPSTGKVIEMSSLTLPDAASPSESSPAATPEPEASAPVSVTVLNGTGIKGLAATAQKAVAGYPERYVVEKTGNTTGPEHTNTIVVDASGGKNEIAAALADMLGGSVTALPEGEAKPTTDLLVILGTDYSGE